jgi:hypothetical protein
MSFATIAVIIAAAAFIGAVAYGAYELTHEKK